MSIHYLFKKGLLIGLLALSTWASAVNLGKIKPSEIGYIVTDLNSGEVLAAHREDASMNPASTMKLLTSYAALRELGEDYRWMTEFKTDGKIENGVLQGNLYWVGSGDPMFDQKDLNAMIGQMKAKGINGINGHLVLDKSIWTTVGSANQFDEDENEAFTTAPDPQMLAFKVAWLNVVETNNNLDVKLEPAMPNVILNTNITPRSKGSCGDIRNYLAIRINGNNINVQGSLPRSCLGKKAFVNILEMDEFASQSFLAHWLKIENYPLPTKTVVGTTPKNAKPLVSHTSPNLVEVLKSINKYSNNTIARTVFLTMGQKEQGFGNTVANGERAMRRSFAQAKLFDGENVIIENGSGLSRKERVTPRFMNELLQSVYRSKHKNNFIQSLPIAGVDGTLRNRFKSFSPDLKLKTGTLKNVRALAGYWLPSEGRQLAIVVIVNSPNSGSYLIDMDKVVGELIEASR